MTNWREYKIADLIDKNLLLIGDGYRAKNSELYANSSTGIPFARVRNINNGFDFTEVDFYPLEDLDKVGAKTSRVGDIVFTSKGTVGRFAFVSETTQQFVYSPQLCFWRTLDDNCIMPQFLFYWMQGGEFLSQVETVKGQTDMADYVNLADQRQMKITLPPLPEQRAIAATLSSLDDKIDLLHRQNKTLEALAETLFRQWFVEEAGADWEKTNLGNHTEVYRGLSYKGSGLSDVGDGLPMHNLNSIFEGGGYKEAGIKYYTGVFKDQHLAKAGDIIVANTEQGHEFKLIGFPAIIPVWFGESGLFSQHIYRLVPKPNSYLTVEFFYYLLMTSFVREQVTSATNGSTVNMLAIDGLQRPEFMLPAKEKVVEFAAMVNAWWKKKEVNQSQIRTLETLRDTLLPKLMSGEVRVSIP